MLQGNKLQKQLSKNVMVSVTTGLLVFFALLFSQVTSFSATKTALTRIVGIGPLQLLEISKSPIDGGFSLSLQLMSGFAWYWVLLFVICALVTTAQTLRPKLA